MSDKKGWGSTVAGWFIERDEPETPVQTDFGDVPVQPAPAASENYTTPSPTQSVFQKAPPPPTGGPRAAVWRALESGALRIGADGCPNGGTRAAAHAIAESLLSDLDHRLRAL